MFNARKRHRRAGRVAALTLQTVGLQLRPGMSTADIDRLVREDTARRGGTPSQLGYHGFPAAVCTSRNEVVCHGIPRPDVVLEPGDIVNVDVTTKKDGYHGDTSRTFFVGEPGAEARHIVEVAREALRVGIGAVRTGVRLGEVGQAIQDFVEAEGCSVVREYGGHGIGRNMHEPPHVLQHGPATRGPLLRRGQTLTIEPMVNLGAAETRVLADGWTVVTVDGSLSAQFEHTIRVTDDGAEILTMP
jgi:methionyl aminopeptidase